MKKFVPNSRSKSSWMSATVRTGSERMSRNATTSVIQTKTGSRIIVMPGARMLMMVTAKFSAAISDETPERQQAHGVEVHARCRRVHAVGERRVGEPAGVRRAAEDEAAHQEQAADRKIQ